MPLAINALEDVYKTMNLTYLQWKIYDMQFYTIKVVIYVKGLKRKNKRVKEGRYSKIYFIITSTE